MKLIAGLIKNILRDINMIPSKAYIIRIDTNISIEYAKECAKSCDNIGLPWEYFEGYMPKTAKGQKEMWESVPLNAKKAKHMKDGAAGCTGSHAHLWKQIADNRECAIILEHDAIMLHPCKVDVPEDSILALGYKFRKWNKYNYKKVGPPKKTVKVRNHPGSHAYALHYKVAEMLVKEIETDGVLEAIDNRHFMASRHKFTKTGMEICDPICAMGWLRESTIWHKSATQNNIAEILDSFKCNFDSELRER